MLVVIAENKEVDDVEMDAEEEEEGAKPVKKNNSKKKVEEEEVADKREHVNIIFIGHVGKRFFWPYYTNNTSIDSPDWGN